MTTILIVEDEVDLLTVLVSALQHTLPSSQVLTAPTAARGLELLTDHGEDIALVIADYHLGADNGLEVLTAVRSKHPDVPTLMVTGQAPPEVEDQALDMGTRVLWKPVNLHQFLRTVQDLLGD